MYSQCVGRGPPNRITVPLPRSGLRHGGERTHRKDDKIQNTVNFNTNKRGGGDTEKGDGAEMKGGMFGGAPRRASSC